MRRCLLWPVMLSVMAAMGSSAMARPIGIGTFGGLNIPIVQEDAGTGPLLGTRLKIAMTSFLALEPTLAFFQQGDVTARVGNQDVELDGGRSTALGVNVVLGSVGPPAGVRVYGILGLASHAMKQEGTEDESRLAMSLGPGMDLGVADKLALDVEVRLHMISLEGGGARKNLGLSGGLIYYLGN